MGRRFRFERAHVGYHICCVGFIAAMWDASADMRVVSAVMWNTEASVWASQTLCEIFQPLCELLQLLYGLLQPLRRILQHLRELLHPLTLIPTREEEGEDEERSQMFKTKN